MNTSRPPPPLGAPPPYAFVTRVYQRNLRPVVMTISFLSALWTLLWAIDAFHDIGNDKGQHLPQVARFDLIIGILYIVTFAIELAGFVAALLQRLPLIRLYAFASVLAALFVVAAGLLGTIGHFIFKNDLLTECQNETTGQNVTYQWGLFGPRTSETLTPEQAQQWCQSAWDHDSWSDIVSLLIEILFGVLFSMVSLSYYHQSLDPLGPANASRAPSNQVRAQGYPMHYDPPYNASAPDLGYDYSASYAPPAGPPPAFDKPPEYGGYGGGYAEAAAKDKDVKQNPFADFDEEAAGSAERGV